MAHAAPAVPSGLALIPAAAVAAGWIAALALAGNLGAWVYAAPALAAAAIGIALAIGGTLAGIARGRPAAVAGMLAFVVFGLSLTFRKRDTGEFGIDPQNGIKLLTWILLGLLGCVHWRRILRLARDPGLALAFAYGAVALASALWSLTPAYTVGNAFGLFAYLGLACIAATFLSERAVLRVMVWSLLALTGVGLAAAVIVPDLTWMPPSEDETKFRLGGFLIGHPNVFAQQAGLLLGLAVAARRKHYIRRTTLLLALGLAITGILLADSRTTLAASFFAWLVVAARYRRFMAPLALAGATGAVLLLAPLATVNFPTLSEMLVKGLSRSGSEAEIMSLTGRIDLWATAWEMTLKKPFLGWGFTGTEAMLSESMGSRFYGGSSSAHNMYFQSLLALGIAGSLPLLGIVVVLVARLAIASDSLRDQVTVFLLVAAMTEVALAGVPTLLTLMVFYCLARDAENSMRAAQGRRLQQETGR